MTELQEQKNYLKDMNLFLEVMSVCERETKEEVDHIEYEIEFYTKSLVFAKKRLENDIERIKGAKEVIREVEIKIKKLEL